MWLVLQLLSRNLCHICPSVDSSAHGSWGGPRWHNRVPRSGRSWYQHQRWGWGKYIGYSCTSHLFCQEVVTSVCTLTRLDALILRHYIFLHQKAAVHVAAKRGLVDTVGYLVDQGADINIRDCNLVSELVMHICVRMASLPCISKRSHRQFFWIFWQSIAMYNN